MSGKEGYLTVKELRNALDGLPDDMRIAFVTDAEGNGHKWVNTFYKGVVTRDHGWAPKIADVEWSAEDMDLEPVIWKATIKGGEKTFVLYPVN